MNLYRAETTPPVLKFLNPPLYKEVTITDEGLQNMAFELGGMFIVPQLWHRTSVIAL